MNYPNGNTVSDVKNKVSSVAVKMGSDIKSEAKDLKSDFKSEMNDVKLETKSDLKSAASKFERTANDATSKYSSIAERMLTSAMSFLPIKNADEVVSMFESTVHDVQSGLTTARDSATSFVKKYPLYSLLGAAAIGAAAVLLFSGRKTSAPVKFDA